MSGGGSPYVTIRNSWANQGSKILTHTSFCHWAAPEYSDTGQSGLHLVLAAISFAVGVWSAYEQMRVFNMRYEIAKGYANLAQEQWDRFSSRYRPLENAMISECLAETEIKPDYPKARSGFTQFAEAGAAQAQAECDSLMKQYCLCPDQTQAQSILADRALCLDDSVNFSYRDQEIYSRNRDDFRFNKRSNILNIGRNMLADSSRYAAASGEMLTDAANLTSAATQGAFTFLGYIRNRASTAYEGSGSQAFSGEALNVGSGGSMITPWTFDMG